MFSALSGLNSYTNVGYAPDGVTLPVEEGLSCMQDEPTVDWTPVSHNGLGKSRASALYHDEHSDCRISIILIHYLSLKETP